MLEGKTANNIVDRYHRIITGDQNQLEVGNPNKVVTVTGTIGNPFGDITKEQFEEFAQKLHDKDISILISSNLGVSYVFGSPAQTDPPEYAIIGGNGASLGNDNKWSAFELLYSYINQVDLSGHVVIDGEDTPISLLKSIVCTTTFIYHPIN